MVIDMSPSRSAASSASKISARRRLLSALRFSGRFSVMRRTRGRGSSTRMCWYDIGPPPITRPGVFMPEIGGDVIGAGRARQAGRAWSSRLAASAEHAAHQLDRAPDAGLAQDVGAVAFDGTRAQSELLGDLLVAFTKRNSFQHFPLASAQTHLIGEIGGDDPGA